MDQIVHKLVEVNGLKLHLAEIGNQSWWCSSMVSRKYGTANDCGYRAIAPDCRGYGLSDPPPETDKFKFSDIVDDLLAVVDLLGIDKISIIAKDFDQLSFLHYATQPESYRLVYPFGPATFLYQKVSISIDGRSTDEEFDTVIKSPVMGVLLEVSGNGRLHKEWNG